jgi:hypothetical protein
MWNYSDEYLSEVQVWGMDPEDVPCTHPTFTEWSADIFVSCVERPENERYCTVCGERFVKVSDSLPPGHDFVTTLTRPGRFTKSIHFPDNRNFGEGSVACSRCGWGIDFPTAIDLVTSRVDNAAIGGMRMEGVVRFTDVSVSSECHPEWGPGGKKIIDGVWGVNMEWPYWFSDGAQNQYVDFDFGTDIGLTEVIFSVYNHGYVFQFLRVDDATGDETLIGEATVVTDPTVIGTTTTTTTQVDPDTGEEISVEVEKEVYADYQILRVPFYETVVRHLRVRITDEAPYHMDGWGDQGIRVLEIHPWGTVPGAGDYEADKTMLIQLR